MVHYDTQASSYLWQVIDLSIRLIVMWSVPYNLNLHDTYMGIAMVYNRQLPSTLSFFGIFFWPEVEVPLSTLRFYSISL